MTDKMKTDGGPTDMAVPEIVSLLPLRDLVVFPHAVVPLAAGRESSLRLIEDAVRAGRPIGTFGQLDATMDAPTENDLHRIGTYTAIHKVIKQPDGPVRLAVQGLSRIRLIEVIQTHPFIKARVEEVPEIMPPAGDLESEALVRNATNLFRKIVEFSPHLPDELAEAIANVTHAGRVADAIAASLPSFTPLAKQELLATADVKARLQRLVALLTKEAEVLELGSRIQSQVESEVGKGQRDYYLREQLKAIQKELGQSDDRTQEIDELRGKIEAAGMTDEAKKEALRELDRLSKMPPAAAEYTVARTYLDWLIAVPWSLFLAFRNLFKRKLKWEDVTAILGIAFFLIVFLLIPFVHGGALFGYWTPRLILPALLSFYLAEFLFIDEKIVRRSTPIACTVLLLVFIQCGIEAVMLV